MVGVEDETNEVVGDDFFDDSRIQNLVNAYLENPPKIQYENIPFPNLDKSKVVGLVTIKPKSKTSFFKKGIHTIPATTSFVRIGSNSTPIDGKIQYSKLNTETVISIENNSRNSIKHTLDGVLDFIQNRHQDLFYQYKVFKELFVVCWAGTKRKVRDKTFYSRVDIELINEQVKLFYSAQDDVIIEYDETSFTMTEYIALGINDKTSFYPLEKVVITFFDNGYYKIESEMLFNPPQYNRKLLHHIYNANLSLLKKLETNQNLSEREKAEVENLPSALMICYLNGFEDSKQQLIGAKRLLKSVENSLVYQSFKDVMRVLRKMKYNL